MLTLFRWRYSTSHSAYPAGTPVLMLFEGESIVTHFEVREIPFVAPERVDVAQCWRLLREHRPELAKLICVEN